MACFLHAFNLKIVEIPFSFHFILSIQHFLLYIRSRIQGIPRRIQGTHDVSGNDLAHQTLIDSVLEMC